MDYDFWTPGEPNSGDSAGYCAYMWYAGGSRDGHWDDNPCQNARGFLCQKDKGKQEYHKMTIMSQFYKILFSFKK